MIAKGNLQIGLETCFGAGWQGQRCFAKTRRVAARQRSCQQVEWSLLAALRGQYWCEDRGGSSHELIAGGLLHKHWRNSLLS